MCKVKIRPHPRRPAITFSVWDDWELIEEYSPGNVRTAAYLQGAHGPIKSLMGTIYYFYQDELGSTSHIADSTGHLLESYTYNLYGNPNYWDASGHQLSGSNPAYNVRDLFSGERFVTELGLYDLRNRFMSPDLGRFLQPDPIGFKGDASNLYRYCSNDWGNRSDPMGLTNESAATQTDINTGDGGQGQTQSEEQAQLARAIDAAKVDPSYAPHDRVSNFNRIMNQGARDLSRVASNFAKQFNSVLGEKIRITFAAQKFNEKSPGWSRKNQCGQQAGAMIDYILARVDPIHWSLSFAAGNAGFFSLGLDNHHAVVVGPHALAASLGFKSFILDGYKNPFSMILGGQTSVREYSPQQFRERYPYRIEGQEDMYPGD